MQGQDTDPAAVAEIRDAVRNGSEASVRLLNYKKNGQPFWNMFTLAPMADVDGNLRFIIGVQVHCCDAVRREGLPNRRQPALSWHLPRTLHRLQCSDTQRGAAGWAGMLLEVRLPCAQLPPAVKHQ